MDGGRLETVAAEIAAARLARARLGDLLSGEDIWLDEAYQLQAAVNRRLEAELGRPVGYKIGGTTKEMRDYIHVPEPVGGRVFERTVFQSGAAVPFDRFVHPGVETEIAIRLKQPLLAHAAPFDRDDVLPAIGEVMAAIEIVDDRYDDFLKIGPAMIIADNAFNAGSALGKPFEGWSSLDLAALEARTFIDGKEVSRGRSDVLLGHPLDALCWIANRLAKLGQSIAAGDFVSLGTITRVQWVDRACKARIEVDHLGAVDLTIT